MKNYIVLGVPTGQAFEGQQTQRNTKKTAVQVCC